MMNLQSKTGLPGRQHQAVHRLRRSVVAGVAAPVAPAGTTTARPKLAEVRDKYPGFHPGPDGTFLRGALVCLLGPSSLHAQHAHHRQQSSV